MPSPNTDSPKVALLCSGLDGVNRGYEAHTRMLFDLLKAEDPGVVETWLYKGDGQRRDREIPLGTPRRHGWLCESLSRLRGDRLYWEYLFFAIAFLARTRIHGPRFSSVVCIEPMLAKTIRRLRFLLPGRPRIVFTHGVWMLPHEYHRNGDCIHEVNVENYARMREHLDTARSGTEVACVPHFLPEEDGRGAAGASLRTELGVGTTHVAVAVGVIDSDHKRTDHLIREIATLGPEWSLLACGRPKGEDGRRVVALGRELLGERFVQLSLAREDVWKAYAAGDVFVLGSLNEGFGLVLLEAMRAGVPVVAHDRPLFRWILGAAGCFVPMDHPGALAAELRRLASDPPGTQRMREQGKAEFRSRFTWGRLRSDYLRIILGRDVAGS